MKATGNIAATALLTVAITLCGCTGADYNKAKELYDSGKYEQAASVFEKLGDYEDSEEMLTKSKYRQARELFDEQSYEQAAQIFSELGAYEKSASMVSRCQVGITERDHADVLEAIRGTWYANGGSNTKLIACSFSGTAANFREIDNGASDGSTLAPNAKATTTQYDIIIDNDSISLVKDGASSRTIPYSIKNGVATLDMGNYISQADASADLIGSWTGTVTSDAILYKTNDTVSYNLSSDTMTFSKTVPAVNNPGNYYDYGPVETSWSLENGLIKLDVRNRNSINTTEISMCKARFNVINGKATLLCGETPLTKQ